jgi:hypothetical protein
MGASYPASLYKGVIVTTAANRPAPGIPGRVHLAADTGTIGFDTGQEWVSPAAPVGPPPSPPLLSSFTLYNQSASGGSATQEAGGILVAAPTLGSYTPMGIIQPVPASTPWSIVAGIIPGIFPVNYNTAALLLYEQSTSKIVTWGYGPYGTGALNVVHGATQTFLGTTLPSPARYFKVLFDGTNLKYSLSWDGVTFMQLYSEAVTAGFTTAPSHYGVAAVSDNATYGAHCVLFYWLPGVS